MDSVNRPASAAELAAGEQQMRAAHERLSKQLADGEELQLEDGMVSGNGPEPMISESRAVEDAKDAIVQDPLCQPPPHRCLPAEVSAAPLKP